MISMNKCLSVHPMFVLFFVGESWYHPHLNNLMKLYFGAKFLVFLPLLKLETSEVVGNNKVYPSLRSTG